jgi:hypothetical protein
VGNPGNTLERLPKGEQTFAGIRFRIAGGSIQLGSQRVLDKPVRVEGIRVGGKLTQLHFLHAAHVTVEEGTVIGYYTINYVDGKQRLIPIVYGEDVRDWWYYPDSPATTRSKVGWEGTNDDAAGSGARIRLYVSTWTNPDPKTEVASIDFISTNTTEAAPFCVAIAAEE